MIAQVYFFLILVFILPGCGGRTVKPQEPLKGIPLQEVCDQYHVQWQWDGVTQVVLMQYQGNKAKALVGSNTVLVGRDKIMLSAPLRREKSVIYVPQDFESKVLAPFGVITKGIPRADLTTTRVRTIVIDPGHGGKDPGTKGMTSLTEKEVNLDIAKRLKELLQEAGLKVIMTRQTDVFVTLPGRTEIASKSDADLFVSIHANSSPNRKTDGIEVYYVRTAFKKDLEEEQRIKNEKMFLKSVNAQYSPSLVNIVGDMMYQRKVEESRKIAAKVARDTSRETLALNRGAKNCRFAVVRNTLIPAILVEVGYLSNREEERRLNTASYRQKVAEGIAHSVIEYANN